MLILSAFVAIPQAWADNCDELGAIPEWGVNLQEMNKAMKAMQLDEALKHGKILESICDQSPLLNYAFARIHKEKGDTEKYLFYLQKSTQNTERFAVDKDMLDVIWSEKYIAANPEADPEAILARKAQIEALKAENEVLKSQNTSAQYDIKTLSKDLAGANRSLDNDLERYKTMMWTGAGIGIGGLVMGAVGAALVATRKPVESESKAQNDGTFRATWEENASYSIGWGLVGAGAALAITGAVLTGIYGYKYTHYGDKVDATVMLSPANAALRIAF